MNKGFIYYSIGESNIAKAKLSISSLKTQMPTVAVTVFTNNPSFFSSLSISTVNISSNYSKSKRIELLLQTPYEKTFYIDSDTYFQADCEEIFELLVDSPIILAYTSSLWQPKVNTPRDYPFLNSGVIGYRLTDEIVRLFTCWRIEMEKALETIGNSKDEPALQSVLSSLKVPVRILPTLYNYRLNSSTPLPGSKVAKILHGELSHLTT